MSRGLLYPTMIAAAVTSVVLSCMGVAIITGLLG
jgi:hypothetical protein